jgi:hypothetical protein
MERAARARLRQQVDQATRRRLERPPGTGVHAW